MPNILKHNAKVHAAKTFLKSFYDVGGSDYIYIGLGNHNVAWPDDNAPPVPVNSYNEEKDFWRYLIGMGKVNGATGTDLVVPRKTWVSGTTYVPFNDATATGSGTFDNISGRNFYICNTEASPKVYRCLASSGTSTVEPTHTNPAGQVSGNCTWAYLYTIGVGKDVTADQLTTSWMPVPSSCSTNYANSTGYTLGQLVNGDGSVGFPSTQIFYVNSTTGNSNNALMSGDTNNVWLPWTGDMQLGAFYATCSLVFPDGAGTGGAVPNSPYRQVGLLRNPLDNSAKPVRFTAQWPNIATIQSYTSLMRGVVLTLDNRSTITRTANQSETIRIALEF